MLCIYIFKVRYTISYTNVLQLQYKLSNDKVKAPVTSIQDDKELEMFITRMRELIVPQCLANGKLSK